MKQEIFNEKLKLHAEWLKDNSKGEQLNLFNEDLRHVNLSSANLSYANLSYADLSYVNLSYANLHHANLSSADLSYANLRHVNLNFANIRYADLSDIKKDFFEVLTVAKNEVVGIYDALIRGKINGSAYEGECACLVGTIANIRHEYHRDLKIKLKPNSNRPSEIWFLAIATGDTPSSNKVSDLTKEWIEEFSKKEGIKLPQYSLVSSLQMPEWFGEV